MVRGRTTASSSSSSLWARLERAPGDIRELRSADAAHPFLNNNTVLPGARFQLIVSGHGTKVRPVGKPLGAANDIGFGARLNSLVAANNVP